MCLMIPRLETPRLELRPLELADAEQTQLLFPTWEVVRFLAKHVPWPYPADGALTYYRDDALPKMACNQEWHWSLRLKSNPEQLIGSISLMRTVGNNRGFWLGHPWHGQGLMSEAVHVVNDFWFNELLFPILQAPKAIENKASRRISEKTGMRVIAVDERDYVSGRFPTEMWEITAAEWHAYRGKNGV
jgi:ribosomal-protein-alanine N-acetyltransferase